MTLTAPATRKIRGFKAGFTIQTSTPPAPAVAVIGTIVVLDNYILTVPVSSVPADADYAQLLWSDTENGTYTVYQSNIPALVTTDVSVNTVTALTKWFKVKTVNAYGNTLSAATSATSSAGSSSTPNQMTNLRKTSQTETSITYGWDALANVTSYTLQFWNGGAGDWATDQVTGITGTTYTRNTLTANTEYGARGRGVNSGAASPNGPLSAETWDFTDAITTPVPTPPTITWQRISSTVIRFLFASGADATSWAGYSRSPSGSGAYSSAISLTVNQASYDLTVAINQTADFFITATNAQGSANSNAATGSAASAALFEDEFERAALTGQPAQNSVNWTGVGGGNGGATLVAGVGFNATTGVRMRYNAGADGTDSSAEIRMSPCGRTFTEYCILYHLFLPSNFTHRSQSHLGQSANNKGIMQSWSGPYSAVNSNQYIGFEYWPLTDGSSSLSMRAGRDGTDLGHTFNGGESGSGNMFRLTERGKWIQFKAHIKLASGVGATDGTIRAWKWVEGDPAAELLFTKTNWAYSTRGNFMESFYMLGWSNSGFAAQTDFVIDKFRISDTLLDWGSF